MSPTPKEWPRHLRERHEWKQYDYLDLKWPKSYVRYNQNRPVHIAPGFEIANLKEYMKRQRRRFPNKVFKVIKDGYGHEIKWRGADE